MAEITAEQVGRALAEGKVASPTTLEKRVADRLATADSDAALAMASQRTVDWDLQRQINDEQIGLRDKTGKKLRTKEEEERKKRADKVIDIAEDYSKKGYDAMDKLLQKDLLTLVVDAVQTNPVIRQYLDSLKDTDRAAARAQQIAEDILRNPWTRDRVPQLLMERGNLQGLIGEEAGQLEIEIAALESEKLRLEDERTTVEERISTLEDELEEYKPVTKNNNPGRYFLEINNLTNEITSKKQEIDDIDSKIETQRNIISYKSTQMATEKDTTKRANLSVEITNAREEIKRLFANKVKAQSEQALAEAKLKAYEDAQREVEVKLDEQRKYLKEKVNDVIASITKDIDTKKPQVAKLKSERALKESQYVIGLEAIFRDAVLERLSAQIQQAVTQAKDILDKDASEELDKDKKRLREHISRRWLNEGPAGLLKERFSFKRDTINGDYDILMESAIDVTIGPNGNTKTLHLNGPERVLLQILKDSGFTEVDQLRLMQDKTFLDEFSPLVAEKVITMKMMTGGIGLKDAIAITQSSWGPEMVAKAIKGKANIQKQIDDALGAGVINWKGNVESQFKKLFEGGGKLLSKNALLILAILAGLGLFLLLKKH